MMTQDQDTELMMTCAYAASREHFCHLTIQEIVTPPRAYRDAYLALHIATEIMVEEFGLSRREVADRQMRERCKLMSAQKVLRRRLNEPVFERAFHRIAVRAVELYESEVNGSGQGREVAA